MRTENTSCVVVGGGPAGMMAGLLLGRQGVDVVVLEKHRDFLRDFRGDTIHPSTLDLIDELGWSEEFHRIPHTTMASVKMETPEGSVTVADFTKRSKASGFHRIKPLVGNDVSELPVIASVNADEHRVAPVPEKGDLFVGFAEETEPQNVDRRRLRDHLESGLAAER